MSNVHIVLQGKGGVGKSLAASMLAQYLTKRGESPLCIDTDPINATLADLLREATTPTPVYGAG